MCLSAVRFSIGEAGIPVGLAGEWFSISQDEEKAEENFYTAFSSFEKELPLGTFWRFLKMAQSHEGSWE